MASVLDRKPDNHREDHLPSIDWEWSREWDWPCHHLDHELEDLFTSLHAEFNTIQIAIQDPGAWAADVRELARTCDTRADFHAALRRRRDDRYRELFAAWHKTRLELMTPKYFEGKAADQRDIWPTFAALSRTFSFDSIVTHFAAWLGRKPTSPHLAEPAPAPLHQPKAQLTAAGPKPSQDGQLSPPAEPSERDPHSPFPPLRSDSSPEHPTTNTTPRNSRRSVRHGRVSKQKTGRGRNVTPREGTRRSARLRDKPGKT